MFDTMTLVEIPLEEETPHVGNPTSIGEHQSIYCVDRHARSCQP